MSSNPLIGDQRRSQQAGGLQAHQPQIHFNTQCTQYVGSQPEASLDSTSGPIKPGRRKKKKKRRRVTSIHSNARLESTDMAEPGEQTYVSTVPDQLLSSAQTLHLNTNSYSAAALRSEQNISRKEYEEHSGPHAKTLNFKTGQQWGPI